MKLFSSFRVVVGGHFPLFTHLLLQPLGRRPQFVVLLENHRAITTTKEKKKHPRTICAR